MDVARVVVGADYVRERTVDLSSSGVVDYNK
jgi:hypothetical protein